MRNADFWPKLNIGETLNTLLDLVSGPIYQPAKPADDLLYSPLFTLPRGRSGMGGQVAVPDASCVVVWGRDGYCHTFGTGIHSLRSCPPGRLLGRWVDMSQRSQLIRLSDLNTADLAKIFLQIDVEFKVNDPGAIIQIKAPLQTLIQMVEGITRQVMEKLPHRALFAGIDSAQLINKKSLERQIRQALHGEKALEGLRILSIKIVNVEGDPTHKNLIMQEALAEQQRLAEEATLLTRQRLARSERELVLFEAKTERLKALAKDRTDLDKAKRQATIFKIESTQREFQREMEKIRLTHEQTLARIEALGQAVVALADPRHLTIANATYAQSNANGRDQTLAQVIDHLTEQQVIQVPSGSNGRAHRRVRSNPETSALEEC